MNNLILEIKRVSKLPVFDFGNYEVPFFKLDEDRAQLVQSAEDEKRYETVLLNSLRDGVDYLTEKMPWDEVLKNITLLLDEDEIKKLAIGILRESECADLIALEDVESEDVTDSVTEEDEEEAEDESIPTYQP